MGLFLLSVLVSRLLVGRVSQCPVAAVTDHLKLGAYEDRISFLWRPEVQNQGAGGAVVHLEVLGKEVSRAFPSASGSLMCPLACKCITQSLNLCRVFRMCVFTLSSLCADLSVSRFPNFIRIPVI